MTMTEDKKIAKVEIDESEIVFTDKDGNIYKTGPMNDPDLVQRLHDSGAEFASQIVEQMSPFLSALLGWIVPIAIFMIIGQVMYLSLIHILQVLSQSNLQVLLYNQYMLDVPHHIIPFLVVQLFLLKLLKKNLLV